MQQTKSGPVVGPQVIWAMDENGVCTRSVGPGLKDLGVSPGQLEGKNLFEVYERDPQAVAHLRRVLDGEEFTVGREFEGRFLSLYYQPVWDADGKVAGAIGVSTDVTEQRRLETEAEESRRRVVVLADLSAALTREISDPGGLLRVAVRALTKTVADIGVCWVPDSERTVLLPDTVLWEGIDLTSAWDSRAAVRLVREHLEPPERPHVQVVTLTADGRPVAGHGPLLCELTDRFDLRAGLRLPLHARGVLVGVIDVARSVRRGDFTDDDVAFAVEVADRCALALDNALLLEAHREAREGLVKFQALADASRNFIGISDNDGRLVYVNPSVFEAGIELVLEDVWHTLAEHAGDDAPAGVATALADHGRWSGDLTGIVQEQQLVVQGEVFMLHHPDTDTVLGAAWIFQDVTDLRATQAALLAANTDLKQFKALVEASTDFIAITDLDGSVSYLNPHGRDLIGLGQDVDVTDTTIADYLTPEGLKAALEIEQPAVMAHGHWEGESTLRNLRGAPIPVAIASFLVRDTQTGEPFALATVQRDISQRLAAEQSLLDLAEQRRALLTRLVDAQDAERSRIAADVHDDPVQALAALDLRLGLLRTHLLDRAPDLLADLDQLKESVTGVTDRLRDLLFDLEPPDLEDGLAVALDRAAHELFENTTVRCTVDGSAEPDVPDATRAVAYRIGREALVNAWKHAAATTVTVTIASSDGGLVVTVIDDGVGLGPDPAQSPRGHRGLLNMEDRATVAGGRLDMHNGPERGAVLTLWLPPD